MIDQSVFRIIVFSWIIFGLLVFLLLLFVTAPYGRHTNKNWGPMIPNKLGWIVMELPSLLLFTLFFFQTPVQDRYITLIFFVLYAAHYTNRSLVYPFRTKTKGKQIPVLIVLFAIFFNLVNGTMNGLYFSKFAPEYGLDWLSNSRFLGGILLFFTGAVINISADNHLLRLRKKQSNGYVIPRGGLFRYVSCPNFLGEMLEWTGFAIMTWSPAALAFALWTIFNLLPRALEHHRWYKQKFPDYPKERKAVVPYLL